MTDSAVLEIALQTMVVALKLSAPILVPALVIGFVISQDSQVRLIANVDDSVIFWAHTMI